MNKIEVACIVNPIDCIKHISSFNVNLYDKIGDYVVINISYNGIYSLMCSKCGNIITKTKKEFKNVQFLHSYKLCKENFLLYESSIGRFNDYIYIPGSLYKDNGVFKAKMKCKYCGHELIVTTGKIDYYRFNHSGDTCKADYYKTYIGKIYGDYEIIDVIPPWEKSTGYTFKMKCTKCGNIKPFDPYNLGRFEYTHNYKNCGENYFKAVSHYLEGQDYEFVRMLDEYKNNERLCEIKCKVCGNVKKVSSQRLDRYNYYHNINNCGYENIKDEIVGLTFGDFKVIEPLEPKVYIDPRGYEINVPIYKCECIKCGFIKNIIKTDLVNYKGVLHDDFDHVISLRINKDEHKYQNKLRTIYRCMMYRCYNENDKEYHNYGGRGITVCKEWRESYLNFFNDMWDSYICHIKEYGINNTSIDRINVNGDYCAENCRWATIREQANNTRTTIIFNVYDATTSEFIGTYQGLTRYCEERGYNASSIYSAFKTHKPFNNKIYVLVKDGVEQWQ